MTGPECGTEDVQSYRLYWESLFAYTTAKYPITLVVFEMLLCGSKGPAEKLLRMVDALEDLDDVQEVYTNADIAAEIYEKLD